MTIEKSPAAASTHKAAAAAGAHGAKARTQAGDAPAGAGASGFMAILGALGETADPAQNALADAGDGLASPVAADGAAAALTQPFDASALLQQNPQIAAAQAQQLADAAAATAAAGGGQAVDTAAQLASDPALQAAQQAALLASQPVAAAAASALSTATEAEPARPAGGRIVAGEPARKDAAALLTGGLPAAATGSENGSQPVQKAGMHAKSGKAELQASADSSPLAGTSAANERSEPNKFLAALEQARAPQAVQVAAPQLAPLVAKVEKSQSERERAGLDQKNADPGYAGSTIGVSAPDYSLVSAPDAAMAPDMQVAEQVSYWVSQNVQNAELKLDGLGQNPVEVSISLQGNEAQISFRSDEAATRGLLESAGAHLKDMLLREGVVLSGVSVGTSGSGDSGGNERRTRQNARQGVIAPLKVDTLESGPRLRTVTPGGAGRSVDLFV